MKMAELSLLPAIRAASAETPLIANGLFCRHQIEHGSGRRAHHIALVSQDAISHPATLSFEANLVSSARPQLAAVETLAVIDG
jgi:hypothetical protein